MKPGGYLHVMEGMLEPRVRMYSVAITVIQGKEECFVRLSEW